MRTVHKLTFRIERQQLNKQRNNPSIYIVQKFTVEYKMRIRGQIRYM